MPGPYRYRHGWIRIDGAGTGSAHPITGLKKGDRISGPSGVEGIVTKHSKAPTGETVIHARTANGGEIRVPYGGSNQTETKRYTGPAVEDKVTGLKRGDLARTTGGVQGEVLGHTKMATGETLVRIAHPAGGEVRIPSNRVSKMMEHGTAAEIPRDFGRNSPQSQYISAAHASVSAARAAAAGADTGTLNPGQQTHLNTAIQNYDSALTKLSRGGLTTAEAKSVGTDLQNAHNHLMPVFQTSRGNTGAVDAAVHANAAHRALSAHRNLIS